LIAVAVVAALGPAASLASAAAPGLVAAYSFDEGTGSTVTDSSGNGNTGTIHGATWTTQGKFGSALSFDGTSAYIDFGNPPSLQITGSMTWSAWIYATGNPADDGQIIAKSDNGGWQLKTSPDTGPHTFGIAVSPDAGTHTQRYSTTVRALNTWYYVTGVYDATARSLHIYVNGALDDGVLRGTVPASQFNGPQNVTIGRRTGGFYFQGTIDEVRVYNRALTQTEIQTDMNQRITSSTDQTPPTVSVTAPAAGQQVQNTISLTADASDNVGVSGVQFYVDGAAIGSEDQTPPYAFNWDTHLTSNGTHTVTAQAHDPAGNVTLSSPVTVNVANTGVFQDEILATQFTLPTSFAFLPDGRMLVGQMGGTVLVLSPPYTQPDVNPFLQIANIAPADTTGKIQGLMNIVVDPNFSTNHYFYVDYTAANPFRTRLSRFTANTSVTGTVPGSELVLYEDPGSAGVDHHGGAILFGNDGKLYLTTGDEFATPGDSQLLTSSRGKILRLNRDGTIPLDNPFYDGSGSNVDSIWALGLRNPFRGYYDAPTGRMFIGDVGGNVDTTATEHLYLGAAGANYAWPNYESNAPSPPYTNGLYNYAHNGRDACIVAGFVYHGTQFPSSYEGSFFFADYAQNWIKRLTVDTSGSVTDVFNFQPPDGTPDGPYGSITQLTEGPDEALYYLDIGYDDVTKTLATPKLRRIRYVQTNLPPSAVSSADVASGQTPLTVNFSSAGSADPEGQPLTYSWTFGDGTTSTAANPSHVYATAGRYTVRLSVSDGTTSTLAAPLTITAGTPPTATILTPVDGSTFRGGDVISYSGTASDAEDGTLPASAYTWEADLLHQGHVHPGLPVSGSTSGTLTIPTSGHDFSGNVRFRISLTVTDSTGISTTTSVIIWPQKVNLTFHTVPEGLTVYVNGLPATTPFVHDELIGFGDAVEARDQTMAGTNYTFRLWSDGGAQSHVISVPATDQSYTATFDAGAPVVLAAYGFNAGSGSSLVDSSGHGLNGTISGASWTTSGKYGGALSFNGSSNFVDLGNAVPWGITGSMTWSAWVYATGTPADDGQIVAKAAGGVGGGGWQFKTSPDTGPHTFAVAVSPDGVTETQRYSKTVRALNTWYYVAGVYDAGSQQLHIYVNGVLDDGVLRGTVPAFQFNPIQNVNIGRRGGGFYFQGRIDELRVYDSVLTQAQIQTDMNTPIG
jgi:glucose/arabinose dehydrogenase